MIRFALSSLHALTLAAPASAHFVFVVPQDNGAKASVILSETLEPDEDVDVALIKSTSLKLRSAADNREQAIEFTPGKAGTYEFTCGMSMLRGRLTVVDDQEG